MEEAAEQEFINTNPVVKRYVSSLYEVASKKKDAERIASQLTLIRNFIVEMAGYKKFLKRLSFISKDRREFVDFIKENVELSAETSAFLDLLSRNNRLEFIIEICDAYAAYLNKLSGKKVFYLTLAKQQPKMYVDALADDLEPLFGKKIKLIAKIDPTIGNGFKLRYRSMVLDYSLNSKLRRLRAAIGENYEN